MEAVQHFIYSFSAVPVAVAVAIGLARYRQLGQVQRYLLGLSLLALLVEIISSALLHLNRPNLFLLPFDTTAEFLMLALIYRQGLHPSVLSRRMPALMGLFAVVSVLTYAPSLRTVQFNSGQRFVESVLVLGFVGSYFQREITRKVITRRLERDPLLWISTGLLVYFSGNILIFLTSNYTLHLSIELSRRLWAVHALLYIFLNILYGVALALPAPRPPARVTQS